MRTSLLLPCAIALGLGLPGGPANAGPVQDANKKLVGKAMHDLFVPGNARRAVQRYFGPTYLQHNPTIPDGLDGLPRKIASLPPGSRYEPGIIAAEGDLVMIHGRYVGWAPKPLVAVDIFRVRNGRLVEHWDVMEEEVPAAKTVSGRAMFPIED